MGDYIRILNDRWDTIWWLGRNYYNDHGDTWPGQQDPPPGRTNPSPKNALPVIMAVAVILAFIRWFFERFIASSVAWAIGIKQCKKQSFVPIPVLEDHLKSTNYTTPDENTLKKLSSTAGLTVRETQVWIRRKQQSVLSTRHTKFVESFWRLVFYGSMFTYGLVSLWDEDYLWDTKHCWTGYPVKSWAIKDKIYWYYMLEMGYYVASLVTQFFEVKRKDFAQMFVHHVATVFLIGMSFITSRTRMGAVVLLVHDFADIPLEACKMAKYAKRIDVANVLFGVFGLSFFASRIVYYPYSILYSAAVETRTIAKVNGPSLDILVALLCILYLLHCYWFSLIVKLLVTFAKNEQPEGDLRSEDEAPSSSEADNDTKKIE